MRATLPELLERHSIPEPNSGCWLWTGAVYRHGYGVLHWDGKQTAAHRLAWTHVHGPIPSGMVVMHKCDTPGCVNPSHLRVGSQKENLNDARAKGRMKASPAQRKLSLADVMAIRASRALGVRATARAFGISPKHVREVRAGRKPRLLQLLS